MSEPSLPTGLGQAFSVAAGELGMCSAAWLFADTVGKARGADGVGELIDDLGRVFPVLDAVCRAWLEGKRPVTPDASELHRALGNTNRLVVVGIEAPFLDALVDAAPAELRIGLLRSGEFDLQWDRLTANYDARLELVEVADFQRWAGAKSALLAFLYGTSDGTTFTVPSWLRVAGPDVRTQFRSFIGWEVLGVPLAVYPRWLVQVDPSEFTEVV